MSSDRVQTKQDWNDDPRITAYALGELHGAEVAEIEALLASEPAVRALVDEVRAQSGELTAALESEYQGGDAPLLSIAARSAIRDEASSGDRARSPFLRRAKLVAASLVGLASIGVAAAWWIEADSARLGFPTASLESSAPAVRSRPSPAKDAKRGADGSELFRLGQDIDSETWSAPPEESDEELAEFSYDHSAELEVDEFVGLVVTEDSALRERIVRRAEELGAESAKSGVLAKKELIELQRLANEVGVELRYLPPIAMSREIFDTIHENDFLPTATQRVSTFSVDVDTAGYSNVRRFLNDGVLPPSDAVRIEELINYFPYEYALPKGDHPFAVDVEVGAAPWSVNHRLLRIGLRSAPLGRSDRKPSNLVFLLDVSGSMSDPEKLPLVKQSLRMLVEELDGRDRVALVVYAGAAGVILEPTSGDSDLAILNALERLSAGGSTNGGEGIQLAYKLARENFLTEGNNRVILATDGDFNVGLQGAGELEDLIATEASSGVFLTVLGFGTGNLQDSRMEQLADKGNGHYAYIDSLNEARKVLVGEVGASLETVAKDVKVQIEFNPEQVRAYRLIGYENRLLSAEDFADDTKDAGEIGAGHRVTAVYELVLVGDPGVVPGWSPEFAQRARDSESIVNDRDDGSGLGELRLRYKAPQGTESRLLTQPLEDAASSFEELSTDTRFAASVAAYGMLLRGSRYAGSARWRDVIAWAAAAQGEDPGGYRAEFHSLAIMAQRLTDERPR